MSYSAGTHTPVFSHSPISKLAGHLSVSTAVSLQDPRHESDSLTAFEEPTELLSFQLERHTVP